MGLTEEKKAASAKKEKKADAFNEQSEFGLIRMDDEVIASIAAYTVLSIEGVAGMVGGMADGITEMFGKRPAGKGVRVETVDGVPRVDVSILVQYGVPIPDLAHHIQRDVVEQVKDMTGISLSSVDVYVQGIVFSGEEKTEAATKGGQHE